MGPVSAQELAERAAQARERWLVPGIALGVLRDGEIVTAADGLCELGRPERVLPETVFRIASIAKPFTATLAMTNVLSRPIGENEFVIAEGEWRGERFDFPRNGFVNIGMLAARVE